MDNNRQERGEQKLREVVGEKGEELVRDLQDICPDLARYVTEYAFADIYSRPGLDLRVRELASVMDISPAAVRIAAASKRNLYATHFTS